MLRHLYKTLIISIMCGSLSILDMAAFAQTTASGGMTTATPPSTVTQDKNGVYKKTDKHSFNGVNDADMLASITMLATGFIAARLFIKYSPVTMDMTIAAAGGAAFIAGEIMSNLAFKKKMEQMTLEITKSSDGKKDQAQIDRLVDLKKSYEEAKKTTNTKHMLQMAAAAAFAAAAATAGYLNYQEYVAFSGCMTAASAASVCAPAGELLSTNMATLDVIRQTPGPTPVKGMDVKSAQGNVVSSMAAMPASCKAAAAAATASGAGSVAVAKIIDSGIAAVKACEAALKVETINQTIKMTPASMLDLGRDDTFKKMFPEQQLYAENLTKKITTNPFLQFSAKIFNLVMPQASAGILPLLGLTGGVLLATFGAAYIGLAVETDFFMLSPFNRVIAWGSLGALSLLAANSSKNQMGKIDENIEKIDKILADLNALEKGIKANNVSQQQIRAAGFNPNLSADVSLGNGPTVKTDCIAGKSSSGCQSLDGKLVGMSGFSELPESFKSVASQAAKMGDGLSGANSISGATLGTVANLGNKANALGKLNDSMKKKLNDQLAKDGKPKIDFDKKQKEFTARLKRATENALQSKGMSASSFLSGTGMAPASSEKSSPVETAKKSLAIQPGTSGGVAPVKSKAAEFDFKEGDASGAPLTADGAATTTEENYDVGENDINTNSGESIFQMISNRYIKSGYPKLLEEEAVKK